MHGVAGELNALILALKKLGDIFPIGGMYPVLAYAYVMHGFNCRLFGTGHHATALEQERTDRCRSPGNNPLTSASPN
jgi:hypothetical protein